MNDPENALWRSTCSETVSALPLNADTEVDLAVIGGGYTGCSAALTAARSGASVCLLEAQEIGFGGSGRNVGLANAGLWLPPEEIRAHIGNAAGDRLIDLLAQAPSDVFALIEKHGIACEPVRNGTLHCAHSAAGLKDLQTRHAQLSASGAPVELLSVDQARERTGSDAFHGALFDPRAGTIQPLAYVVGLARAAAQTGAQIHGQSPVQTMRHENGQWVLNTPKGVVRAKSLIQATNAYHLGLPNTAPAYVPVYYFQYATAPLSHNLRASILPQEEGCWDTGLIMTSFRLDQAGRMIIGGMGDLGNAGRSAHTAWVRRKLAELYPQLADQPFEQGWHGRIAMTSDHIPKITQIGPNALAAHGYSGRGIGPGTVFGRMMAESLLAEDPSRLPMPAVPEHRESWTRVRRAFFESGAALTHLVKARF
ncbi:MULTISPECIES: FAD-binding oxidoreductase [unclassified Ruegeria]|uniref:NAD(P)/FAD-dependent oxidoreductase n=1 Tax=unclassified Ruegeria TaxID=2625375 RepID=UPI0014879909|nr:FAD-dependent oxidoreductase [Ruegeria sp. HKCCD4332]NOD88882.1 FAD-dependent oxidoreductase [Ruegeria sp. HKCCD4318]NOE14532.1 FAD-dependent oxidoreductase [Ruegeria sp. HKCCD4318-2]NOG09947.1 FAD-binding oxidoreductase [Ruegeria sp. HKCCD4315]